MDSQEILLEVKRVGATIRVSAIHVATGTEIVFQAPASMAQVDIRQLASQRLAHALKKK